MKGAATLVVELPKMVWSDIHNVGLLTLLANAVLAFLLNVTVVCIPRR